MRGEVLWVLRKQVETSLLSGIDLPRHSLAPSGVEVTVVQKAAIEHVILHNIALLDISATRFVLILDTVANLRRQRSPPPPGIDEGECSDAKLRERDTRPLKYSIEYIVYGARVVA